MNILTVKHASLKVLSNNFLAYTELICCFFKVKNN